MKIDPDFFTNLVDWVYLPFFSATGVLVSFFYNLAQKLRGEIKENNSDIEDLKEKQGRHDERLKSLESDKGND